MPAESQDSRGGMDWVTLIARLQPWYLLIRFPQKAARAAFAAVGAAIAIGIICTVAIITGQPLVFPTLGPSAFLFFSQPAAPASCPRNAIVAHGSGILIGWAVYWLFGIALSCDAVTAQVGAATVSLGLISAWMVAAKVTHPPAASTALMVALGLMVQWQELAAVMAAIVLLTAEAYCMNRLSGIATPLWRPLAQQPGDDLLVTALQTDAPVTTKDSYAEIADLLVGRQKLPS